MRRIEKGEEPKEWTAYRQTPGARYSAIPELRNSLLEEQGYICAYCMRRIPHKDAGTAETAHIEHLQSRSIHPDKSLNYSNMVICCPGAISQSFHCDKLKGNQEIHFDIFSCEFHNTLSYSTKSGDIKSSNELFDSELNQVLNLNNALLKRNRLEVLKGVVSCLNRSNVWKKSQILALIKEWDSKHLSFNKAKDEEVYQFREYCGVVVWYLKRKLQQMGKI